jgi:molybdopterin synthase catalytic subunit
VPVRIQREDFDAGAEASRLRANDPRIGAVASFVGVARDRNDGTAVSTLALEHSPGMTEKAIEAIVNQAKARWAVYEILVIHRIGILKPLDQIVLVVATSSHRGDAFAACEFVMDYLKTEAPFWKKESTPDGERWVDARESDEAARSRWEQAG